MEVLWPIGTHRLLWAAAGTDGLDHYIGFENLDTTMVFGDFTVCPLSKDIRGEMRHVCIREAQNLKRQPIE